MMMFPLPDAHDAEDSYELAQYSRDVPFFSVCPLAQSVYAKYNACEEVVEIPFLSQAFTAEYNRCSYNIVIDVHNLDL